MVRRLANNPTQAWVLMTSLDEIEGSRRKKSATSSRRIEQEEPGTERLVTHFRVPHEEPAGEAATGNLDPAVLVGEKLNMSRSLA